ncbi:Rubisco LSMT, substrate-binding domain [Pseudocohnilembus persalinus]|uniref:Rubisco LSMT, substrate-binding domain n=1 Tax=Pseudocohnilembus persalinus TaxID=266149 RepID=A0A0V0QDC0_PSEPJ|nr:Rubisco LSMT, substrate-binding domain [Pseudocohnilembus persalinus]|eukprot:KRX00204.1 Rubisco LSMT, substrate-binding domain [Pseudocohnilembus persalinus]
MLEYLQSQPRYNGKVKKLKEYLENLFLTNQEKMQIINYLETDEMNLSLFVKDEEINLGATKFLKESEDRVRFCKWVQENGLLLKNVDYPVGFGLLGVPGIAASDEIPENTILAAVPNKMIINVKKALESELIEVYKSSPKNFNMKINEDAEFNILTLFLIREYIKGTDSFWYPYISSIGKSYTLYDWTKYDTEKTEDPEMIEESRYYADEIDQVYWQLGQVMKKFPQYFPPDQINRRIFVEFYQAIMTRCFGYSVPSTCLIPFADLLNHNNNSATHYTVQTKYEQNPEQKPANYVIKQEKIDMDIFQIKEIQKADKTKFKQHGLRIKHVYEQKAFLEDTLYQNLESLEEFENLGLEDKEIKDLTYVVNYNYYKQMGDCEKNQVDVKKINEIQFITSSNTEDNDTSEDDENQNFFKYQIKQASDIEQDKIKFKNMLKNKQENDKQLENKEIKVVQNLIKPAELDKCEQPQIKKDQNALKSKQQAEQEYRTKLEEKIKRIKAQEAEEREEKRLRKERLKAQKKELKEEYKQNGEIDLNQQIQDKLNPINKNINMKQNDKNNDIIQNDNNSSDSENSYSEKSNNENEDEDSEQEDDTDDNQSSLSEESIFDWYETNDQDTYFIITSQDKIKKGEQIFNCYGRRTNKFLLMWYGFCFQNNKYDSFTFRMNMSVKYDKLDDNFIERVLFRGSTNNEEMQMGTYNLNGENISIKDLTKEFRLKKDNINIDVIIYLRALLVKIYEGQEKKDIFVTLPVSLDFEIFVLKFYKKIINYFQSQYSTSIEKDEELLKDHLLSYKKRFAIVLRVEQKKILQQQSVMIEDLLNFINMFKRQQNLHKSVIQFCEQEEYAERFNQFKKVHRIKSYLIQIQESQDKYTILDFE